VYDYHPSGDRPKAVKGNAEIIRMETIRIVDQIQAYEDVQAEKALEKDELEKDSASSPGMWETETRENEAIKGQEVEDDGDSMKNRILIWVEGVEPKGDTEAGESEWSEVGDETEVETPCRMEGSETLGSGWEIIDG